MSGHEPVTIESLRAALADLEREVRALSQQADTADRRSASRPSNAAAPRSDVARAVRTEAVAASFVANAATLDRTGGWFVTLAELGRIHNDQARAFVTDAFDTLRALRHAHSPRDVARATLDHWQRRAAHIADGVGRATDVIAKSASRGRPSTARAPAAVGSCRSVGAADR